jgi:hypothetical protein
VCQSEHRSGREPGVRTQGGLSLATKKWKKGRYTFVLQFKATIGTPGPVAAT